MNDNAKSEKEVVYVPYPNMEMAEQDDEIDLIELWKILWKGKWFIAAFTLACNACGRLCHPNEVKEVIRFKILDKPYVPELRFKPKRTLICALTIVASGFFAVFLVFFMQFVSNARNKPATRNPDKDTNSGSGLE